MTGLSKLFLSKLSRCQWSHLVEVVLLLEAHAHLLEVLPVGEHDALGITDFIQKHFHSFGLNNEIMIRFGSSGKVTTALKCTIQKDRKGLISLGMPAQQATF